jgi:UPF0716 protein FxsA
MQIKKASSLFNILMQASIAGFLPRQDSEYLQKLSCILLVRCIFPMTRVGRSRASCRSQHKMYEYSDKGHCFIMFARLLILFTVIPLLELFVLLKVGAAIGLFNTIILVVATALTGAFLAKQQGIETLSRIRQQLAMGTLPADELIEGVLILIAAVLLITPGLITDTFGISLLIPFTRSRVKTILKKWFSGRSNRGDVWMKKF